MKTTKEKINRHWRGPSGDIPSRDAVPIEHFTVVVIEKDVTKGVPNDIRRCAIARAIARLRGITLTQAIDFGLAVYRNVAIVPTPDELSPCGWTRLRFRMHTDAIRHYDKTKAMKPQQIILRAPTHSQTLVGKSEHGRELRATLKVHGVKSLSELTGLDYTAQRTAGQMGVRGGEVMKTTKT